MTVRWSDEAKARVKEIYDYIAQDNRKAAEQTLERVLLAVDQLEHFPLVGRTGRVAGTRELVIASTPYLAVYRVKRGEVQVLTVAHGAQSWPTRFPRMQ